MSNVDRWLKRRKELESELAFGDVNYVKLKEGPNVLRIIPPKSPREDFWMESEKSFNVGPNGKVITRPSFFGLPDPVSDEIAKLKKLEKDEVAQKRADSMKGKKRAMMWVIMRSEEGKGHQLFDTNFIVLKDILAVMVDAEYGDITHPTEGTDLTINYTPGSKKSFPKWGIVPRRASSPLGHPEVLAEDLFEKHHIGEPSDVDYIKACLEGSEEAYIESKKADRADKTPEAASTPSAAPAGDEEAVMEAELARIRAAKAAKASATAPAPPLPPGGGTAAALLESEWWAVIGGESKQVKGTVIQGYVDQGHSDMSIMAYPEGAWTTADAAGFVAVTTAPAAPPPPPSSQVGADLEEALG